jgi:hypothetical protein
VIPAPTDAERAANRRAGMLRGLAIAREARARLRAVPLAEQPARARLTSQAANRYAAQLERRDWRTEGVTLCQGEAMIQVRGLSLRVHPLVATLRTFGDVARFLAEHSAHGLRCRGWAPCPLAWSRCPIRAPTNACGPRRDRRSSPSRWAPPSGERKEANERRDAHQSMHPTHRGMPMPTAGEQQERGAAHAHHARLRWRPCP